MNPEITETVTEWESVPVGSGYAGLQSLADESFSGAVSAGLTWAFFLNGRVVGVFDGSIGDFDDADLSAYTAPDPSLPLLFAMQETGGETRAQYYTNDTPLQEVDRTLSSGNFSGYVELSENVLSGDYYVVYHGGRSMSVAFVGASRRLVTDDEAFDLAADEVGIYDVNAVDVEVVEIPEASGGVAAESESESGDASGVAATGGVESADSVDDADDTDDAFDGDTDEDTAGFGDDGESEMTDVGSDDTGVGALDAYGPIDTSSSTDEFGTDDVTFGGDDDPRDPTEPTTMAEDAVNEGIGTDEGVEVEEGVDAHDSDDAGDDAGSHPPSDESRPAVEASDLQADDAESMRRPETADEVAPESVGAAESDAHPTTEASGAADAAEEMGVEATNGTGHSPENDADIGDDADTESAFGSDAPPEQAADVAEQHTVTDERSAGDDVFTAEQAWREARQIPALSPDDTMSPPEGDSSARGGAVVTDRASAAETAEGRHRGDETSTSRTDQMVAERGQQGTDGEGEAAVSALEEQVRALEARLESTEAERDELTAEVEELTRQLEAMTRERDKYRVRVADLESELERLQAAADTSETTQGSERLSPAAAREQTNLFVRYRSKGKPTLENARAGDVKQSDVVENLRMEYHTTFDADAVTVDGKPYEEFLRSTTEWRFVKWVVEELLYEIGRSGNRTELAGMFDRIPEIDRIQFDGEVAVTVEEDGTESHESRTFDLVFRDSMGDPLFVVDVDTNRDATSASAVGSLVSGARAVGMSKDTLGGAFYVTTSFFDSKALDAVGEATSGGLLSRSSKKSFVKLSRKQGYHLCLVEARSGEFHLAVPEL